MDLINGHDPEGRCRPRSATRGLRPSLIVASVAMAAVGAGACGSDGTGGSSASGAAVAAYGRQKFADSPASPLADYLGYGDRSKLEGRAREQSRKQQDLIAACMAEQGFDYVPFTQDVSFLSGQDPFGDLTRAEYAAKWGFGISTTISADGSPVEGSPFGGGPGQEQEDPNQRIRDGLSESERAAYDRAFYGGGIGPGGAPPVDGEDPGETTSEPAERDTESMGCQGKAFASEGGFTDQESEADFERAFEELSRRLDADKRTKAAKSAYRACMAAAGFGEVKEPDEVYELVSSRMEKLFESPAPSDDEAPPDDETEGGTPDEGDDGATGDPDSPGTARQPFEAPPLDAKGLREVQKYELSLAKAELPCQAGFRIATEKVQEEYEREFIAENKELLDDAKAAGGLG